MDPESNSLAGRVVVITGASSGIGRALAVGFAGDGATVVGCGTNAPELHKTAQQCRGGMVEILADLRSETDIERLFTQAEALGSVDILVACAGLRPRAPLQKLNWQEWCDTVAVNLTGVAWCCRRALRAMRRQRRGRIVVLGSRAGATPLVRQEAYSASKAGVNALVQSLAADLNRQGQADILVDVLFPGVIRSNMSSSGDDPGCVYPWVRRLVLRPAGTPTGRMYFREKPFEPERPLALLGRAALRLLGRSDG